MFQFCSSATRWTRIAPRNSIFSFPLRRNLYTYDSKLLPSWIKELQEQAKEEEQQQQDSFAKNYDLKFYDELEYKSFDWNAVAEEQLQVEQQDQKTKTPTTQQQDQSGAMWALSRLISAPDKVKLNGGKDRSYVLLGECFGFPDYRDNPVYFSSIRSCYLWYDPATSSQTPKLLLQLGKCFPPLLWLPIKPSFESMQRVFDEFAAIESKAVSQNVQQFDEMLQAIQFKEFTKQTEDEKSARQLSLHQKMLQYLNNVDPDGLPEDEHENNVSLFMGNLSSIETLEQTYMNNPFVFNTPILLGSSNKYMKGQPAVLSKFRTVYSRSIITFESRIDLHMELGDGGHSDKDRVLPVFCRINYPSNTRCSKPIPNRVNKVFGTDYPEDVPLDVVAALFGNAMRSYETIKKEFFELYEKTGDISIYNIIHIAILRDPNFEKDIFDRFYKNEESMVRLACLKGAAEMGIKEAVLKMKQVEKNEMIQQHIDKCLENWDKKSERRRIKLEEAREAMRKRAEAAAQEELERQQTIDFTPKDTTIIDQLKKAEQEQKDKQE